MDIGQTLQTLQNMDLKEISKRKDILINIGIIVLTLISAVVIYKKQVAQKEVLRSRIERARESNVPIELISALEDVDRKIESHAKSLPSNLDFPQIINEVTDIARENNVGINTIAQGEKKHSQLYYTLALSLSVRGFYYDILGFLRAIEDSEALFVLDSVNIQNASSSLEDEENRGTSCSVDIRLHSTSARKE